MIDAEMKHLKYSYIVPEMKVSSDSIVLSPEKRERIVYELASMAQMEQVFKDWERFLLAHENICNQTKQKLLQKLYRRKAVQQQKTKERYMYLKKTFGELSLRRLYSLSLEKKDLGFNPEIFLNTEVDATRPLQDR